MYSRLNKFILHHDNVLRQTAPVTKKYLQRQKVVQQHMVCPLQGLHLNIVESVCNG